MLHPGWSLFGQTWCTGATKSTKWERVTDEDPTPLALPSVLFAGKPRYSNRTSKPPGIHKNYTFRYPTFGGGPYRPIATLRKQSKQLQFTQLANSLDSLDGHLRDRNARCLWPHSSRQTVTCIEPFEPLEDTATREFPICDLPAYHLRNSG